MVSSMQPVRRAVIDVGTNSIKLLVAEVSGRKVQPLLEDSQQTRLGSGLYEHSRLQAGPIATSARVVADFAQTARAWEVESIRVIATSAARDAENSAELTKALEKSSGVKVDILTGDQEADWVFQGVTSDPKLARRPLLLLDVGGGSTEFIVGLGAQKHFRHSFPMGTVRLLEKIPHSEPPKREELAACRDWLREFFESEVKPMVRPALRREKRPGRGAVSLVATGGTATILARMEKKLNDFDRAKIEGARLSLERVRWHTRRLWTLPLAERILIPGLPAKRADVILTGVAIYEAVMEHLGFYELRVSTRGLRFAAVMTPDA